MKYQLVTSGFRDAHSHPFHALVIEANAHIDYWIQPLDAYAGRVLNRL